MKPHAITTVAVKLVLGDVESVDFAMHGQELPDEDAMTTVAQLAASVITSEHAEVFARAFLFQMMVMHRCKEVPDPVKEQAAAWTEASHQASATEEGPKGPTPVWVMGKPGGEPN